jgi:hypothetical protein
VVGRGSRRFRREIPRGPLRLERRRRALKKENAEEIP